MSNPRSTKSSNSTRSSSSSPNGSPSSSTFSLSASPSSPPSRHGISPAPNFPPLSPSSSAASSNYLYTSNTGGMLINSNSGSNSGTSFISRSPQQISFSIPTSGIYLQPSSSAKLPLHAPAAEKDIVITGGNDTSSFFGSVNSQKHLTSFQIWFDREKKIQEMIYTLRKSLELVCVLFCFVLFFSFSLRFLCAPLESFSDLLSSHGS